MENVLNDAATAAPILAHITIYQRAIMANGHNIHFIESECNRKCHRKRARENRKKKKKKGEKKHRPIQEFLGLCNMFMALD